MKKFAHIFVFLVFVIPTFELHQLWKIKDFVAHYREHRFEDTQLSLVDFILLHYTNQLIMDDDVEKDMKLPFKDVSHCFFNHTITLPTQIFSIPKAKLLYTPSEEFVISNTQHLSEISLASIWQPPKA